MRTSGLGGVLTKYDWAKKHVHDFERAADDFRQANPYTVGRKVNDQTGDITYFVESVPEIPSELSLRFGDSVHNLRSTLDHLAHALVFAAGGAPDNHTCFPIFDTSTAYTSLSRSKVPGLG